MNNSRSTIALALLTQLGMGCASSSKGKPSQTPLVEDASPVAKAVPVTPPGTKLVLTGPFPSLHAFCEDYKASPPAVPQAPENRKIYCQLSEDENAVQPLADFLFTTKLRVNPNPLGPSSTTHIFALKTPSGWFVERQEGRGHAWNQQDEESPHIMHHTRWSAGSKEDSTLHWNISVSDSFQGYRAPSASSGLNSIVLRCNTAGDVPLCAYESDETHSSRTL